MQYIIHVLITIAFAAIAIFSLSNIFLPIFYTIPRLRKEKNRNNLNKKVPVFFIVWPPILWTSINITLVWFVYEFFNDFLINLLIGYIMGIIFLSLRIFSNNNDLEDDFRNAYGEYFKK